MANSISEFELGKCVATGFDITTTSVEVVPENIHRTYVKITASVNNSDNIYINVGDTAVANAGDELAPGDYREYTRTLGTRCAINAIGTGRLLVMEG